MYQIIQIMDREGVAKGDAESRSHVGCVGDAKMDEGCVLFHCRYDKRGEPVNRYIRTSLVQDWQKDASSGRITVVTMNSIYVLDQLKKEEPV